jgi:Carboxypeptidase regulatory-like domain/TonB-dependent Receptor Plug Domain
MKKQLLLLVVLILVGAKVVCGQSGLGTILGTVTDTSGGAVANASVTLTETGTNVSQKTQTTSAGTYNVPYLRPGLYRVTVTMTGFQKSVVDGVTLTVDQENRVDVILKPGTISESVTVEANAIALDTDNAAVSQLVSQKQVTELPLNGRDFQQLLFIGAGAVMTGGEQGTMRSGQGAAVSINGSRPESNTYLIDGMLNTDQALNTPAASLSIDAIQEFKVLSETYSAQYGFSANQISIVSKGGTNELHGALFEFNRNDAFDAKNFFTPLGTPNQELRQNQFGFVAGGPVYIPKLYDGRNKTFWLANYEGWRTNQGVQQFANVPDPANVQGFFTSSVTDPTTGLPFAGCSNGGTNYVSCIPSTRFSRLANVGINAGFFAAPNCNPADCQGNNYRLNGKLPSDTDQQTYRLDQDLGKYGRIFGRGSYLTFNTVNGLGTSSGQLGQTAFVGSTTNWAINHSINFGTSTVNEFHFGRLNTTTNQTGFTAPESVIADLGLTGIFTNLNALQRIYPYIQFQNNAGFGANLTVAGGAVNAYTTSNNPMWQFGDTVSLNRGKHTVTVGADYKRWVLNRDVADNFLGNYTFAGLASGNQFADYLLGYYSAAAAFVPGSFSNPNVAGNPRQYNFQYFAVFGQDDWQVNSRLTVNLGLRWDLRTVPNETHNHMGWLDTTNALGGMCIADPGLVTDGIAPPGNGFYRYCGRRNPADSEKHDFGPRIGFAYRPFEKTVVRGGYGIFWDGIEGRETDGSADIYPYVSRLNLQQTAGDITQTTDQVFPSFTSVAPVTPAANSFIAVIISEKPQNPYMQQWTLSVQRELARNTTLEVNYVGNKGTHLLSRNNINQALPMSDPAFCAENPTLGDCPVSVRRPYAQFSTYIDSQWSSWSSYNAMNVKFERRTSSMAITAIYTWAKSLDDKSAAAGIGQDNSGGWQGFLNNHDPARDYGPSDFNVGQRFVSSFVYQLPVGRGKRVLSDASKPVDMLLGGWQLTGIVTFQQGFPMTILAGDPTGLLDSFGQNRADQVGKNTGFHKGINEWFNTAAYVQPAPNVFGNTGRDIITMPGINNWDVGILKNFTFTERLNLQLRLETFNTWNHPQFFPDPSTPAFAGGGTTVGNNVDNAGPTGTFGKITAAAPGRIMQLGAKFNF